MNNSPRLIFLPAIAAALIAALMICASAPPALAEHPYVPIPWAGPGWYVGDELMEELLAGPFPNDAACKESEEYEQGDEFVICDYFDTDPG